MQIGLLRDLHLVSFGYEICLPIQSYFDQMQQQNDNIQGQLPRDFSKQPLPKLTGIANVITEIACRDSANGSIIVDAEGSETLLQLATLLSLL